MFQSQKTLFGLWLGMLLTATSAFAAINQTFNFSDATAPQAVDRMFRDGIPSTCAVPGPANLLGSGSMYSYQTHTFFNNGPARCVTVQVSTNACVNTNFIGFNAYSPTVTPATRTGGNFLGDAGSSPAAGVPIPFSFNAPANAPIVIWVDRSAAVGTAGLVNCDYTIQSAELDPTQGVAPPQLQAQPIPTLSGGAIALLVLLLAMLGILRQRARRT